MRAIVFFDSMFGNTETIAYSIAKGLQQTGIDSDCADIKAVKMDGLAGYDLVAAGAPTQYFTASKPMKEFLGRLKGVDLKGKAGFAFDTKLESRFSGSAAKFIEKRLTELGLDIIRPRASAIVIGQKADRSKGEQKVGDAVLKDGMQELFETIGKELGGLLQERRQKVGVA